MRKRRKKSTSTSLGTSRIVLMVRFSSKLLTCPQYIEIISILFVYNKKNIFIIIYLLLFIIYYCCMIDGKSRSEQVLHNKGSSEG